MTTNTMDNGLSVKSESFNGQQKGARAGAGLVSMAAAFASAGDSAAPAAQSIKASCDVGAMPIAAALATVERPAGALLFAVQGKLDLELSRNCGDKLAGRMRGAGAIVSQDMVDDATGAAALALTQWRATGANVDGEPETIAARVAWRAVVKCLSADRFGDSISIETVSEDWVWHNCEQRDESRRERAARLMVERLAATRQLRLARRMASLPSGRGKRGAVIERVTCCAQLLLDGFRLDEAAAAAGFNVRRAGASLQHSAGDSFCRALRRLGFKIQAHARQSLREQGQRRGEFVALTADKVAAVLGECFAGRPQTV